MNIDDGEIRRIENMPTGAEEQKRWVELKAEEVEPLINTPQAERPQRLAEMRGVEWGQLNREQRRGGRGGRVPSPRRSGRSRGS